MSYEKFVQISLVLAACAAVCTSHPDPRYRPTAVNLETALNNTVCPMRVEIDEDLNRIPRRIKTLKCQENPHAWCTAHDIRQTECCGHHNNRHYMECVEVQDQVLVKYTNLKITKVLTVSVGCSCLVGKANPASTIPPPT